MNKFTSILAAFAFAFTAFALAPADVSAQEKVHKLVFQVSDNDPKKMNLVLNNAANVKKYYDSIGEKVTIEIVAYGPGLNMLRADNSPVKDRIEKMSLEIENLSFAACGNTRNKMAKKEGKDIPLLDEAVQVTSGVVRLITLQEEGYAIVRP